jgi:hypothetical protein
MLTFPEQATAIRVVANAACYLAYLKKADSETTA